MAHLQVIVDGQTKYDGDVDDVILPSRPELFPDALRATAGQTPSPLARLTMLTALIEVFRRAMESPMLQPIEVEVVTHGPGRFTMAAEMTLPTLDPSSGGTVGQ